MERVTTNKDKGPVYPNDTGLDEVSLIAILPSDIHARLCADALNAAANQLSFVLPSWFKGRFRAERIDVEFIGNPASLRIAWALTNLYQKGVFLQLQTRSDDVGTEQEGKRRNHDRRRRAARNRRHPRG